MRGELQSKNILERFSELASLWVHIARRFLGTKLKF